MLLKHISFVYVGLPGFSCNLFLTVISAGLSLHVCTMQKSESGKKPSASYGFSKNAPNFCPCQALTLVKSVFPIHFLILSYEGRGWQRRCGRHRGREEHHPEEAGGEGDPKVRAAKGEQRKKKLCGLFCISFSI